MEGSKGRRGKVAGSGHVLNRVQDIVVQGADDSEEAGLWTLVETVTRQTHVHPDRYRRTFSANRISQSRPVPQDLWAPRRRLRRRQEAASQRRCGARKRAGGLRKAAYRGSQAVYAQGTSLPARANRTKRTPAGRSSARCSFAFGAMGVSPVATTLPNCCSPYATMNSANTNMGVGMGI